MLDMVETPIDKECMAALTRLEWARRCRLVAKTTVVVSFWTVRTKSIVIIFHVLIY